MQLVEEYDWSCQRAQQWFRFLYCQSTLSTRATRLYTARVHSLPEQRIGLSLPEYTLYQCHVPVYCQSTPSTRATHSGYRFQSTLSTRATHLYTARVHSTRATHLYTARVHSTRATHLYTARVHSLLKPLDGQYLKKTISLIMKINVKV